jgi:PBSX family phage terminase large subunit
VKLLKNTPSFSEFNPSIIPFQDKVIDDIYCNLDYSKGTQELLCSGSIGSSKSILGAHLVVRHCLEFRGARVAICRRALPQLRETIFTKIIEHLQQDNILEGRDYYPNESRCSIWFPKTGSEILSITWADKKSKKARSYELSCALIEEATENEESDKDVIDEILMRCGRLPHIPHKWLMFLTNPDAPSHFIYKRFFVDKNENRRVYLSKTEDNPFLPPEYIKGLKAILDPKMARRMLYGEWLDIRGETIYHQYGDEHEPDFEYTVDRTQPVYFSWDFNIGSGKPLSTIFYQKINGIFHFFDEVVIEGARTESNLEDAENRGLFKLSNTFICQGDASGKHKDTRNNLSDYDIIDKFMHSLAKEKQISYSRQVPTVNPPVRKRHNIVNAYLRNDLGQIRILVYPKAKTLREAFRLTKLKKGADYIEDDTKFFQHVGTAAGYGITWHELFDNRKKSGQREA